MEFLGARVQLNPRPALAVNPALEVAMLGHCPGLVRVERFGELGDAAREIRQLGFGERLDACLAAGHFNHVPIPLRSSAEFTQLFPEAHSAACQYRSRLAGSGAWLPKAVHDFFANGGEKLWLVQIPENEAQRGFFPRPHFVLHDVESLYGLAIVFVLNEVGLIAAPDLERLQIPQALQDIPHMRLRNPEPQFLPVSTTLDDGHRERRTADEFVTSIPPLPFAQVVQRLADLICAQRPDIQCLLSLPLAYSPKIDGPHIDEASLANFADARLQPTAYKFRQMQLVFPYLRSAERELFSGVGALAGATARSARVHGVWRSIAKQKLLANAQPYPALNQLQKVRLREEPGVGVLEYQKGQLTLDDERIVMPALHRGDYQSGVLSVRLKSLRSGEVVRFIGYLVRNLRALGETLIFNVDYRDSRPRLLLEKFLNTLFAAGALRGARPDQAYRISQSYPQEGVIAIDIEIAPAYPIDKIVLTFVNRDGHWLTEVKDA